MTTITAKQALADKFGTVDHSGVELALTQDAYVENHGTDGGVRYYAKAVDAAGNEYLVAWDTTALWDERCANAEETGDHLDDESAACDWAAPAEIKAL